MKIVKRNLYVSEFQDWPYWKRLAYLWLGALMSEEHFDTPLNPLDWSLRSILRDMWIIFAGAILVPLAGLLLLPYMAHRLKTRYSEYDPDVFIRDEYVLE